MCVELKLVSWKEQLHCAMSWGVAASHCYRRMSLEWPMTIRKTLPLLQAWIKQGFSSSLPFSSKKVCNRHSYKMVFWGSDQPETCASMASFSLLSLVCLQMLHVCFWVQYAHTQRSSSDFFQLPGTTSEQFSSILWQAFFYDRTAKEGPAAVLIQQCMDCPALSWLFKAVMYKPEH